MIPINKNRGAFFTGLGTVRMPGRGILTEKGNSKNACAGQGGFLRRTRGEVHVEPSPSGSPSGVKGSLRLDVAGLSATPPDGVKKPKRFFAFLRVRQGCWRRCLFELPLGEVFVVPESLRAGATGGLTASEVH